MNIILIKIALIIESYICIQYSQNWSMNSSNPRITNFISTTKDENNASRIIAEIKQMGTPTLHYVLCKFIECSIVREQPEFLEILFKDHLPIIVEMIEWMLIPKSIAKRKKIKSNLDFFPYRCKQFIRDNISFYEKLYTYARLNILPLSIWFNFLRKQFYDKETIQTALGYFGQVMIPFAKYEFTTINKTQPGGLIAENVIQERINIMKILPKQLIDQLVSFCHFQHIFQFLKTAVLVSIEDPIDYEISKTTLLKILLKSHIPNIFFKVTNELIFNTEENTTKMDLLQYLANSLKELIANLDLANTMQLRIQYFITVFIQSQTIPYVVDEILLSKLCSSSSTQQLSQKNQNMSLSSSQEYPAQTIIQNLSNLALSHGGSGTSKNSLPENEQEDLMEIMLKILSYSVEIFNKIPKFLPATDAKKDQEEKQIINVNSVNSGKKKVFMNIFREQLQYLLNSLYPMTKIVYGQTENNSKTIPFSSGQKIKPISFMKFQFLRLINNCLLMIRTKVSSIEAQKAFQKPSSFPKKLGSMSFSPFELNFEKLNLIPIIQKYLNENRWNNITHHIIEKICHSLILCGYDYLRKNVEKDKKNKLTESFLAFLVESFTQRDYIFLNTFKFTSQGNLQSIYNISRDLAHTLNNTNKLVILLNQFQPWNKFIMNDLKLYEEKAYRKGTSPADEDDEQSSNLLKVDEADTIKNLVQNIYSQTRKWPQKIRPKGNSKSGIFESTPRNDYQIEDSQTQNMTKSHGFYLRTKNIKKTLMGPSDLYSKKVEDSIEYKNEQQFEEANNLDYILKQKMTKSDIKISEKETEKQLSELFKSSVTNKVYKMQRKKSQNSI